MEYLSYDSSRKPSFWTRFFWQGEYKSFLVVVVVQKSVGYILCWFSLLGLAVDAQVLKPKFLEKAANGGVPTLLSYLERLVKNQGLTRDTFARELGTTVIELKVRVDLMEALQSFVQQIGLEKNFKIVEAKDSAQTTHRRREHVARWASQWGGAGVSALGILALGYATVDPNEVSGVRSIIEDNVSPGSVSYGRLFAPYVGGATWSLIHGLIKKPLIHWFEGRSWLGHSGFAARFLGEDLLRTLGLALVVSFCASFPIPTVVPNPILLPKIIAAIVLSSFTINLLLSELKRAVDRGFMSRLGMHTRFAGAYSVLALLQAGMLMTLEPNDAAMPLWIAAALSQFVLGGVWVIKTFLRTENLEIRTRQLAQGLSGETPKHSRIRSWCYHAMERLGWRVPVRKRQ